MNLWKSLNVPASELRIHTTLMSGQSFRWIQTDLNTWTSVLNNHLISLTQTPNDILYSCQTTSNHIEIRDILYDYFQLNTSLEELYKIWNSDENFRSKSADFMGLRVLRQDPIENAFTFICTSNNNIKRITLMISNMCKEYGKLIGTINDLDFYSFPTVQSLAQDGVDLKLRELGFGYRAKFIYQSAIYLCTKDEPEYYLYSLRGQKYSHIRNELMKLPGIGPKVADCVSLMSMDVTEALPVDTHLWQIAKRDYKLPATNSKTLNDKTYAAIGDHFRKVFGSHAGWAHSVLFAADLKQFQHLVGMKKEMNELPQFMKIKKEF